MSVLDQPLKDLLGGRTATALAKHLGLERGEDLLRHYPRRYARRGELTDLGDLVDGESVTIMAEISSVDVRSMRSRKGSVVEALLSDGRSSVSITFFNQRWREGQLKPGRRGLFAGQVTSYRGRRQLAHPEYILMPDGVEEDPDAIDGFARAVIPVYPAAGGVTSWEIAKSVRIVLDQLEDADPIPVRVLREEGLLDLPAALRGIHQPADMAEVDAAVRRLAFEEAFVLQTVLARRRQAMRASPATPRAVADGPLSAAFEARLPFALTEGQLAVGRQIAGDLAAAHPMHRLLQGEVGSGKTVVALRAMLAVVDAGGQCALLAPTEVLAQQHYRSLTGLLGPLAADGMLGGADTATRVALLTGSQRTAERRRNLLDAASGAAGIVVGTHALLQENVEFADLALVVVDEQHRFGVEQRATLAAKAKDATRPHVLVMTATPIPRTVAITAFGDLDVSTLEELPVGRAGVDTHLVVPREQPRHLARLWERVREEVAAGHRVFVVCPRIDAAGKGEAEAADSVEGGAAVLEVAEELASGPLAGVSIGLLHGRMSAEDKDETMRRFADTSALDPVCVLVATTVVEVGVDVPDATVMVVMDADRFGVSQLHQLRGRVGRGSLPGLCLLVTDAEPGSPARERLEAIASTNDGFALAQLDLEQRGEGDVLGAIQSGSRSSLRLLQVVRDAEVIERARGLAAEVVAADPNLEGEPALRRACALVAPDEATYLEKA